MNKDQSVLIVGGAGYIGSHVNKELFRRGYRTLVYDNLVYGHRECVKWGDFVLGDLSDEEQLRLVFKTYHIDVVMHFGAFAYVGESVTDPAKYYINNVSNTLNLLKVMREFGIKYFIFSSTCATYGNPMEIPIPETHVQNPINPYGKSKLMIETILSDFSAAYGLKYISLRYFNAAGADSDAEIGEWHNPETHLIPLVLDAVLGRTEHVNIFGTDYDTPDGTCVRDYIHVTDLADAHIRAMEHLLSRSESQLINLGNGNGYSVKQVIETAGQVVGKPVRFKEAPRRPGDPPVLVGDWKKAKDLLQWNPKFSDLKKIIETAWAWHTKLYGKK